MEKVRLNKFIAEAGVCSRREADRLIEAGKVKINGRVAGLGDRVSPEDEVTVRDRPIRRQEEKIYFMFHKPFGVITTTDKNSNNTVMDYVKVGARIFPIGRLDVQSSGLLLLTNDGSIVNKILKSENKLEKEYLVTLNKTMAPEDIEKMRNGIKLDGRKTLPAKVEKAGSRRLRITLTQGMYRQIRRMCERLGYEVKELVRIRIGEIYLDDLGIGQWRHLSEEEIKTLPV